MRNPLLLAPALCLPLLGCKSEEPVVPTSAELVSPPQVTGLLGVALPESLAVRVVGSDGKPFKGAEVAWMILSGGGSVSPATSTTNADGIARTSWTLGTRLNITHSASAAPGTLPAIVFSATPQLPSTAVIQKVGGDGQQQTVDLTLPDSLTAAVKLADGRGVEGVTISWSPSANAGTLTPATAITNASGQARASWRLGTVAGTQSAAAAVATLTAGAFTAVAVAGAPDTISIPAQTKVLVGGTVTLTARVVDKFGNAVTTGAVSWGSTSSQIATVASSGQVTGIRYGRTTIEAMHSGKSGFGLVGVVSQNGFGTPLIDGVLAAGEWASATTFQVPVVLPGGGTTPGTLYVMNDQVNLYLAFKYSRSTADPSKGVQFQFDNSAGSLFGLSRTREGDDHIALNSGSPFMDAYWTYRAPCPAPGPCGFMDTDDGGTVDGSGAFGSDGTTHVFEVAHPLRSADTAHDLFLLANQDVGMRFEMRIIATGGNFPQDFGDTTWPTDGLLWLRIRAP